MTTTAVAPYRDCCYCCSPSSLPKENEEDLRPVQWESPKETWRQVVLFKKDAHGEFIKTTSGKFLEKKFTLHVPSGDIYWDEEPMVVATKCWLITFGNLIFSPMVMVYHLGKTVYDICKVSVRILQDFGKAFKEKGLGEGAKILVTGFFWHLPRSFGFNVWMVVRDVFYAIRLEVSAIAGIFSPLNGRRWIAMCEYEWHYKTSYKKDPKYDVDCEVVTWQKVKDFFLKGEVYYLALCMQVRGNLKENKNLVVKTQATAGP